MISSTIYSNLYTRLSNWLERSDSLQAKVIVSPANSSLLALNYWSDSSSLRLNRYSYLLLLFFLNSKLSHAFSSWWIISILLSDFLISAWYLSNQSILKIRIVSVPFTTYKVSGILICYTDKDISLIKPITFILEFPFKDETLILSFASIFN